MKKIFLLGLSGLLALSCSNDDNGDNSNQNGNFLPVYNNGNYWVYDVESSSYNGRDSIYVSGDTVINNKTYKKIKSKDALVYGFFSNSLSNNGIRNENGKTFLSGTAGLNITEQLPFEINVADFVIFDKDATANQQLASVDGIITQEIEGYTLKSTYILSSVSKPVIANFTSGDQQYTNVKPVEITLNLTIDVTATVPGFPFPVTLTIMEPQNILVSTQYYVEGIGAVKTISDINYNLTEIPGYELPIPSSGTEHQEEILIKYNND